MLPASFASHRIGLGTWQMGESRAQEAQEVAAITHALEIGYRLIDTAEMYASGGAERVIGKALQGFGRSKRSELTIVSKVLPSNASRKRTVSTCEAIIGRMGCEYLDVYLLHWQGSHPYEETLAAFIELRNRGLIRAWGVSNFDIADLQDWEKTEESLGVAGACATDQVYYALSARGVEFDLLPYMGKKGMPLMAYSPIGCGELATHTGLTKLARSLAITPAQLALAWLMRQPGVIPIPKSSNSQRLEENFASCGIVLSDAMLAALNLLFVPPKRKQTLAVI
jgi:diketogulonate reductase-like aldo/keto reductase